MAVLGREWNGARSRECPRKRGEDAEVGVKRHVLDAAHTKRRESGLVLKPTKRTLYAAALPIQVAPPLRLTRDQRVQPGHLDPDARGLALTGRAAPLRRVALRVETRERPRSVVALGRAIVAALHGRRRMDVKLSVIVATLGRPSLDRTIASIGPQLGPDDEVLVATRFPEKIAGTLPVDERWWLIHTDCDEAYGGANERNQVMPEAKGTHLCFIDDDDVYAPGALQTMRENACDRPVIFRMDGTRLGIGVIWREPVLKYTNVSTQTFLVPNVPGKLGHWQAYQHGRGCDYAFITSCDLGEPVFREEIIAICRPHESLVAV